MSYAEIKPEYYRMHQPDSPWHAGAPGWKSAPWPSFGVNPNLVGPPRLAVEGIGAYFKPEYEKAINGLGAYFKPEYEKAINGLGHFPQVSTYRPVDGVGACPCAGRGVGDTSTLTTSWPTVAILAAACVGIVLIAYKR